MEGLSRSLADFSKVEHVIGDGFGLVERILDDLAGRVVFILKDGHSFEVESANTSHEGLFEVLLHIESIFIGLVELSLGLVESASEDIDLLVIFGGEVSQFLGQDLLVCVVDLENFVIVVSSFPKGEVFGEIFGLSMV